MFFFKTPKLQILSDLYSKHIQDWLPKNEKMIPFYIGVDQLLEEYLVSPATDDFEKLEPKIIADPLLGYIHLTALEVAIIDTKLFQRLRKIRQLGLAYLIFPSLSYSRFEHSLGVLGRLNQVLNKLIENNNRTNSNPIISIIDDNITSLRLAALLHDLGHCLFSHCSERVIERVKGENGYPDAQEIQYVFTTHFKKEKNIPFAEIFSVAIVGSRRFQLFIEHFSLFNTKVSKKILESTGRFILGLPVPEKPDTLFLSQLISSGLDVDKIDYMVREQHYSGIKLEIDLDRILSKLKVFDLKSFELPKNLEHHKKLYSAESVFKVLGFEKGGQFVFEEFCVARLALHVKIYLHQKVRAAESQLSKYLETLIYNPTLKEVHNWLRLTESIIEVPEAMNYKFPSQGTLFQFSLTRNQIESFKKIDFRNIYYRAFSFGPMNSYSEGYGDENIDIRTKKLETYFEQFQSVELKQMVISEAIEICDDNNIDIDYQLFEDLVIEYPRLLNIQQGQESLYFERASWLPLKWTIPIDKILIYFQENRALAFFFAPKEVAHIVSIAAEKLLFDISGKVFSQEANISKITFNEYTKLKETLTNKGFYIRYPQLKPVSAYLGKAEASEMIQSIEENLAGFKSLNDEYITINRVTTFVNQFPLHLQEACLSFLKCLKIYNENLLKEEVEKILSKITNADKKTGITYLGTVSDSGGHLAYYLRSVLEIHDVEPREFTEGFILENERLVFYDDNINSGLQLVNIFAEMIDEKDKLPQDCLLDEKHHRKLVTKEAKEKFKRMPIYIAYIVGNENATAKVKSVLSKLGFNPDNIHISVHEVLQTKAKIFSGSDSIFNHVQKKELRDFLSQIGAKLLKAENKNAEKVESCKLGYANAEAMVLFPYNIPTMTITALWCRGDIDGTPWIPLAERRRRGGRGSKYVGED